MSKKYIAVFLAIILVFTFSSCTEKEKEESENVVPVGNRGTIDNNVYTNKKFNLSFKALEGWNFLSDVEIVRALGLSNDEETNESAGLLLEQSTAIYDMYCVNGDFTSSIQVNYELVDIEGMEADISPELYLETILNQTEQMILSMDSGSMSLKDSEITVKEVGGKLFPCLNMVLQYTDTGASVFESILVKKVDGWMASVIVTSSLPNDAEEWNTIDKILSNVTME